jgi:hypothetical protein
VKRFCVCVCVCVCARVRARERERERERERDSHSSDCGECCILGCSTMLSGKSQVMFWRNILLPSSELKNKPGKMWEASYKKMKGRSY